MMDTNLEKLAERCEAATGPDRELDADIAPLTGLRLVDEGHPLGRCCYDKNNHNVPLPAYTRSLDAAMTLVPESFRLFNLGEGRFMTRSPAFAAQLEIWTFEDGEHGSKCRSIGVAATPALALTAACLRARAQDGETRG